MNSVGALSLMTVAVLANTNIKEFPPEKSWTAIYSDLVALTSMQDRARPTWISFRRWHLTNNETAAFCAIQKVGSSSMSAVTTALRTSEAAALLARPATLRFALVRHPVERFLSWYNEKILGECDNPLENRSHVYNRLLLEGEDAKATTGFPLSVYAHAVRRHGTANLDPHQRSYTRMCLLGAVHYDVIGRLEETATFLEQVANVSRTPLRRLPHLNDHASVCTRVQFRDLDEMTIANLAAAYSEDYIWLERLGVPYDPYAPFRSSAPHGPAT